MSLLQKIAEQNGAQQAVQSEQNTAAKVEESRPDAVALEKEGRAAYGQAMVEGEDRDMVEELADPAEQEAFTRAERALAEKVFGPGNPEIIKAIQTNGDPVKGVGSMAAALTDEVYAESPDLTEDALFSLGESAVEQLVELAESADPTIKFNDDQMAEALSIGLNTWMDTNPEMIDGDLQSYQEGSAPLQLQQGGEQARPDMNVVKGDEGAASPIITQMGEQAEQMV